MLSSEHKQEKLKRQQMLLKIMALKVAETISGNLQATSFYTIMADETTDCANKEQFVVCFRWVDSGFEVHEDFVGLRDVKSTDAETLSAELKDVLVRLHLSPSKMRGQCYDGASCMAGVKSGVAARLSREENPEQCTPTAMDMHSVLLVQMLSSSVRL